MNSIKVNLQSIFKSKAGILLLFILIWSNGFAQIEKTFHLEFDANVREKKTAFRLVGANISVFKNGSLTQEVIIDESGRYKFKLEPDADYELKFSKVGYVSKILSINTENVPPKDLITKHEIFVFKVNVDLFKIVPNLDVSILDGPVGKIYYDKSKKDFDYDEKYSNSIRKEIETLLFELAKKEKEEEDALKAEKLEKEKLERLERAEAEAKAREEAQRLIEEERRKRDAEEARKKLEAEEKMKADFESRKKAEEQEKKRLEEEMDN